MAFRQCATGLAPDSFIHDCWQAFCTQYERNDRAENDTLWRSCDGGTSVGWPFLLRHPAPNVQAHLLGLPSFPLSFCRPFPPPPPFYFSGSISSESLRFGTFFVRPCHFFFF